MYKSYKLSISSILPVVTSHSTASQYCPVWQLSVTLLYFYNMSLSQRSVCDCNKRIFYCIVSVSLGPSFGTPAARLFPRRVRFDPRIVKRLIQLGGREMYNVSSSSRR